MVQYKNSKEFFLALFLFISQLWEFIKTCFHLSQVDADHCQPEIQCSTSSDGCHKDGIEPYWNDGDHHHVIDACSDRDLGNNDDEEIYFFSDSESETDSADHSHLENICEDEEESRWSEMWTPGASGFPDLECK